MNNQFIGGNPFGAQSKMLYHIDRLYEYLYKGDTYPTVIEANLTNKCNLSCYWCINENYHTNVDKLDKDRFINFLKEFYDKGGQDVTFTGGGEPTQHPDFEFITKEASKIGLNLALITNGIYNKKYNDIIGRVFEWARFSLDIVDKVKYKKWKGVDGVDIVLSNLKQLKEYDIQTNINTNITNNHTLQDIINLSKLTPEYSTYIQFRPVIPRYFKNDKSYINEDIWEWLDNYKIGRDYVKLSNDKLDDLETGNQFPFSVCDGHFFNPVLDANGNLCVCMYHPNDERFVFGNIYKNTFEEIWKSEKRKSVIDFVRKLDYGNECQMCCKLTEINKFLDFINHPEKNKDCHFL